MAHVVLLHNVQSTPWIHISCQFSEFWPVVILGCGSVADIANRTCLEKFHLVMECIVMLAIISGSLSSAAPCDNSRVKAKQNQNVSVYKTKQTDVFSAVGRNCHVSVSNKSLQQI